MQLSHRIALITGASSGVGEVIARFFLKEGARVFGCGLEPHAYIEDANFAYRSMDITNYSQVCDTVKACLNTFGRLDILVNCAGITGVGRIENTTPEEFKRQFEINVFGVYNMCKAALDALKQGEKSVIVNIGSELGQRIGSERIAYCPSKAAVHMLTQCLAVDCGPEIRVNGIMPGVMDTPMTHARFEQDHDYKDFVTNRYVLKKLCTPEDVANAAVFLASEKAGHITGELMAVCGGGHIFICN